MIELFSMFGDKSAIERAITTAFPKTSEVPKIEGHLATLKKELEKIERGVENLITAIANGSITESEVRKKMAEHQEKKSALVVEINTLELKLSEIPSKKDIEKRTERLRMSSIAKLRMLEFGYTLADHFPKMAYEDKRDLIEQSFGGADARGKRLGVYVRRADGDGVEWAYTIKGILPEGEITGSLPMSKEREDVLLGKFDPQADLMPVDFIEHDSAEFALS